MVSLNFPILNTLKRFVLIVLMSLILFSCKKNNKEDLSDTTKTKVNTNKIVGYLYTTTNGEGENEIVQLARHEDGTLSSEKTYPTGGKGGSDHSAPAHGDYDAQGNLKIVGNVLITTNPGDNTISTFRVNKTNGDLKFLSIVDSHGDRPVTLDFLSVEGSSNEYWVAVGNQWGTPTVLYDGDKLKRYPDDAFFKQDLTKPDASDKDRSIQLFKLNSTTGELTYQNMLSEFVRQNGGPADVKFSPDGKKIAVTLWGIPHFFTPKPILKETRPSRVYVYDFKDGKISNPRYFEEDGIVGTVGFHWSKNSDMLYTSNFNLIPEKFDNGLTVLKDNGNKVTKLSKHITGGDGNVDEACWTMLSPDNKRLYVCSYVTNVITTYELNQGGTVGKTLNVAKRGDYAPLEDSKDIYAAKNNKYVYLLGSFFSYSVNVFEVTPEGLKYKRQYTLAKTKDKVGQPGVYDLVGLDGFDL